MSHDRPPRSFPNSLIDRVTIKKFAIQTSSGILSGVGANLSYKHIVEVLGYLFVLIQSHSYILVIILSTILMLLIGAFLFWIRGRFPIVYGTIEVVVGVTAAINALARAGVQDILTAAVAIQILGGVYIIVRGLDNIGKGVKGTPLEPRWNDLFTPR